MSPDYFELSQVADQTTQADLDRVRECLELNNLPTQMPGARAEIPRCRVCARPILDCECLPEGDAA